MKWTRIRNPRWLDETNIHAMVTFEGIGEVPFTANPHDVEAHGRAIYAAILSGEHGPIAPVDSTREQALQDAIRDREKRAILRDTRWPIDRHDEQRRLGIETTDGPGLIAALVHWRQQIRDWNSGDRPRLPMALKTMFKNQEY